jgi:hypothetical protein
MHLLAISRPEAPRPDKTGTMSDLINDLITHLRQATQPHRRQGLRYVTDGHWSEDEQRLTIAPPCAPSCFSSRK